MTFRHVEVQANTFEFFLDALDNLGSITGRSKDVNIVHKRQKLKVFKLHGHLFENRVDGQAEIEWTHGVTLSNPGATEARHFAIAEHNGCGLTIAPSKVGKKVWIDSLQHVVYGSSIHAIEGIPKVYLLDGLSDWDLLRRVIQVLLGGRLV